MMDSGMMMVARGLTTPEEVLRVAKDVTGE